MACCSNCARFLIGTVSIAVLICGVVAAAVVYKKQDDSDWSTIADDNLPFIFILVAMAFAVVTSVIGLLMICCKKRCLAITYLVILVIVILFEIACIVLAFVYGDNILDSVADNWLNPKVKKTRETVEKKFDCCGYNETMLVIEIIGGICGAEANTKNPTTCYKAIKNSINDNLKQLQIAIIVMCVVEIVLLISAIYLVCSASKGQVEGIQYD